MSPRPAAPAAAGTPCVRCALPMGPFADRSGGCDRCRGQRLGFDQAIALGPYEGSLRHLPSAFKARTKCVDISLGGRPTDRCSGCLRTQPADACVATDSLALPLLTRGYNQADALAVALARRLRLQAMPPLRRVVPSAFTRTRRPDRACGHHAPCVPGQAPCRLTLRGRTVLLVDDILTTMQPAGCAAPLKRAGAAHVVAVVVGRAEGKV